MGALAEGRRNEEHFAAGEVERSEELGATRGGVDADEDAADLSCRRGVSARVGKEREDGPWR